MKAKTLDQQPEGEAENKDASKEKEEEAEEHFVTNW